MINFIKTAFAAGIVPPCDPTAPATDPNACNMDALLTLGENIVNTLIGLAFIITTIFLLIGAFKLIISQGAPNAISSAKKNITSAIVGLVIVLVAWVVLNTLINFFVDKDRCDREWWRFQGLQCELTTLDETQKV